MSSAAGWLFALKRLQQQAFRRSTEGERIPIHTDLALTPGRPWRAPELRVTEQPRRVQFALHMPGAAAGSTRVCWSEEAQTLTVHAIAGANHWYAEIAVGSDVDGTRAEGFLKNGTLRIVAPRVDSKPLTGLPLLAWPSDPIDCSLAAST